MLLLVYDYMPYGSLDKRLFGGSALILSWGDHYKILLGAASALQYLHSGADKKVVHRGIKSSNIMLDSDLNAYLGDFELALGSFDFLVNWVRSLYCKGRILEAIDKRLENNIEVDEAERVLLLGLACSHPIAEDRPRSKDLLLMLSGCMPIPDISPFTPTAPSLQQVLQRTKH
ncbi:hypothetical protein ACHQM5_004535 [Ranunculus cassubicifolius]